MEIKKSNCRKTKVYNSKYEDIITKSMLENDMYNLKLSSRKIAEKYDVGKGTIQNLQYKYQLEILNMFQKRVPENFTYEQKQLIYGTSIADGHLFRKNKNRHAALKIVHSVKQIKYLNWKYDLLKDFVRTKPTTQVSIVKNSISVAKSFRTLTHGFFTELHDILYLKRKKILTDKMLNKIDEMALAVMFMDDGTKHHKCRDFCFECFSKIEQEIFCNWLKKKYDIDASLIRYKNETFRTRVIKTSVKKFVDLIEPYILNSMKYKL